MMHQRSALAAVCALVAAAGAARAEPLPARAQRAEAAAALKAVQTICIAHRVDRAGALAAADADGWAAIPAVEYPTEGGLAPAMDGLHIKVAAARFKATAGGGMVLLLGDQDKAPGCVVAFHAGFRVATSVLGGWMPIPRSEAISPAYNLWAYIDEGGKKKGVLMKDGDTPAVRSAMAKGTMNLLSVIGAVEPSAKVRAQTANMRIPLPSEAELNSSVYYYTAPVAGSR